jgi:uncharacterized membrane protein
MDIGLTTAPRPKARLPFVRAPREDRMKKSWQHSVDIEAPIDQVYELVAGFDHHPEWDRFTKKVELLKEGDANGSGAEWRVYEQMGLFSLGQPEKDPKFLTGIAKRVVRNATPNERIDWYTHPVPNIGITAEMSYEFAAEGSGTKVTFTAVVSVPGVLEKVGRIILRNLDTRQQSQWQSSLEHLKSTAEGARSENLVAVGA